MTFRKPWRAALLSVCGCLCDSVWVEKAQGHISGPIPIRELCVAQTILWWGESEGSTDEKEVTWPKKRQQSTDNSRTALCGLHMHKQGEVASWQRIPLIAECIIMLSLGTYTNLDPHKAGINGHQRIPDGCGLLWVNQETEYTWYWSRKSSNNHIFWNQATHSSLPPQSSQPFCPTRQKPDRVAFHVRHDQVFAALDSFVNWLMMWRNTKEIHFKSQPYFLATRTHQLNLCALYLCCSWKSSRTDFCWSSVLIHHAYLIWLHLY